MNSFYGKLVKNLLISMAAINLVITSMVVIAENDFDRSLSAKSQPRFGYLFPKNLFVEKKYSEFLGGPGKRSDYDDYPAQEKRYSEFLGGPGKRSSSPRNVKRLSEFLGGPGK